MHQGLTNEVGGGGAGSVQYAEDSQHTTGDLGTQALVVRQDVGGSLVNANLDYAPLQVDANGNLRVTAVGAAGGTSMVDDAAFTPAVTNITPMGAFFDDVAPDSVDEGDGGVVRMSANRNLYSTIRDAAGNERGLNVDAAGAIAVTDGGGALSVDDNGGSLTVDDGGGSITVDDGGAPLSVDDNGGSLTVDNPALSVVGGGVEAAAQRVTLANDSTGLLSVDDNGGSLTVDNPILSVVGGGVEATAQRVTLANDSTGVLSVDDNGASLTVDAAGDIADDAVDSGNPVKLGGVAVETDGTDPTSVSAEGDRAELRTDRNRRLLVNTGHPNAWYTNNNYGAAQTNQQQKAAPGANLSLYITGVIMSAEGACNIKIVDDTAGAPADILGPYYFAAFGGLAITTFEPAIRIDPNTDIGITSSAAVNHTVTINGYTAP